MSEHTPGPWKMGPFGGPNGIYGPSGLGICSLLHKDGDLRENAKSNARLIAASPDLLAAIEGALSIESLWGPPDGIPIHPGHEGEFQALSKMRKSFVDAVNKATGGETDA